MLRKQNKRNRFIALVLALALCVTMMPMTGAVAESNFNLIIEANGSDTLIHAAMGAVVRVKTVNAGSVDTSLTPRWQLLQGDTDAQILDSGTDGSEYWADILASKWGSCQVIFRYKESGQIKQDSVEIKYGQITHTVLMPDNGRTQIIWNENEKKYDCAPQTIIETVYGKVPNKDGGYFTDLPLYGATVDWKITSSPISTAATIQNSECMTDGSGHAKAVFCSNATGVSTITVQAGYQLSYPQYPVDKETATWTWYVEELVKIPQVRWAGEEIVLEKKFGTNYAGKCVHFVLENQSPGAFEDKTGWADTVWTTVDSDGIARANLICETQGQVDAEAVLYSGNESSNAGQIINKHGFVVYYMKMEDIYLGNVRYGSNSSTCSTSEIQDKNVFTEAVGVDDGKDGVTKSALGRYDWLERWGDAIDPVDIKNAGVQDAKTLVGNTAYTTDVATDTIFVTNKQLLRTRVRGWFTNDNPSTRPERIEDNLVLPRGRWVFPDDWAILAMGNADMSHWEQFRRAWDLHEDVDDSIFGPTELGAFDSKSGVIGPYMPLIANTILSNGRLNWLDCPMPPAKVSYKILDTATSSTVMTGNQAFDDANNRWNYPGIGDEPGYFLKADKGCIYWKPVVTELTSCCGPELDKAFIAPFYKLNIPSSPLIPPFINNGGYDWDSFGFSRAADGPYDLWNIMNTDWSWSNPNPTEPKEVQVYSDEHGEAMVKLSSGEDFNTRYWDVVKKWKNELGGFDIPFGEEVGRTFVTAFADYPYLRKHPPTQSNDINKGWRSAWFKTLREERVNNTQKKVIARLQDIHGNPIVGEKVEWSLTAGNGSIVMTSPGGTIPGDGKKATTYSKLVSYPDPADSTKQVQYAECWIMIHNSLGTGTTDVVALFPQELIKRDIRVAWTVNNSLTYTGSWDKPWFLVAAPTGTDMLGWLYSYSPVTNSYTRINDADPNKKAYAQTGVGYWGWYTAPTSLNPDPLAYATGTFNKPLQTGWNLIGNPFAKSAKIEGSFTAYTFDNASYNYELATSIPVGQSAWIYNKPSAPSASVTLTEM